MKFFMLVITTAIKTKHAPYPERNPIRNIILLLQYPMISPIVIIAKAPYPTINNDAPTAREIFVPNLSKKAPAVIPR